MKKIIFLLLTIVCLKGFGQTPNMILKQTIGSKQTIVEAPGGLMADTLFAFPTGCGSPTQYPTFQSVALRKPAQYFDSCAHRYWLYDPKLNLWDSVHLGVAGGGSTDSIHTTFIAYVDTLGNDATGTIGNPAKPFLTMNAALNSLPAGGGIVKVGYGTFASPDTAYFKSNIYIYGSGKPSVNSVVTYTSYGSLTANWVQTWPTKLIGGTIFRGQFYVPFRLGNITLKDFGVDVGSDFIGAGATQQGLIIPQYFNISGGQPSADSLHKLQTATNPRLNVDVENISVLQKDSVAGHCLVIENCYAPFTKNITTYGGDAGIVLKNIGGTHIGNKTYGAGSYPVIIKSNDYAYSGNTIYSDFEIGSIGNNYNGAGMLLNNGDGSAPNLINLQISNGIISKTKWGIKSEAVFETIKIVTLSNIIINNTQSEGILFDGDMVSLNINSCIVSAAGADGIKINTATGQNVSISSTFSNYNTGNGFNINYSSSGRADLNQNMAIYNSGYGFLVGSNVYGGFLTSENNTTGQVSGTVIRNLQGLATASADTTTYKPVGINSSGTISPMTYWPGGGGSGGITSFTDGSGFDGTVAGSALSLTTTLSSGAVPYIGSAGSLNGNQNIFSFDAANTRLGLGVSNSFTDIGSPGWGGSGQVDHIYIRNTSSGKFPSIAIETPSDGGGAVQFAVGSVAKAEFGFVAGGEIGFINRQSGQAVNIYHNAGSINFINTSTGITALKINASGNISIGNANDAEKLDVTGNVRFSGALMPNNTAGTSGQKLTSAGAGSPPTWTNDGNATGTYTPTITNGANVAASTAHVNQWSSVTDPTSGLQVINVSGYLEIDPTTTLTATTVTMDLPVCSSFSNEQEAGGTFMAQAVFEGGGIKATASGTTVTFSYICTSIASNKFYFTFTYKVIGC